MLPFLMPYTGGGTPGGNPWRQPAQLRGLQFAKKIRGKWRIPEFDSQRTAIQHYVFGCCQVSVGSVDHGRLSRTVGCEGAFNISRSTFARLACGGHNHAFYPVTVHCYLSMGAAEIENGTS